MIRLSIALRKLADSFFMPRELVINALFMHFSFLFFFYHREEETEFPKIKIIRACATEAKLLTLLIKKEIALQAL